MQKSNHKYVIENMRDTPKNIELINTYSVSNVGDAAIYATLLKLLNDFGVSQVSAPNLNETDEILEQYLGLHIDTQNSDVDSAYLAVGGDIFNNSRPIFITKQFINNLLQLSRKPKNTILFAQSIPRSCSGISFRLLCHQLKKITSVIVRDQESFYRLQQAGVATKLSYDSVFAAPIEPSHTDVVQSYFNGQLSEMALISLRSFDRLYPHDSQLFVDKLEKLVLRFKGEGMRVGIILQSQVDDCDSDIAMIEKINARTSVEIIDPFSIQQKLPHLAPWQIAQAVIAAVRIVVGVRYHTSIFRLIAGKTPFNLYYSNKGEDLCQRLGVPGCSVADFSIERDFPAILATENKCFDSAVIADQVAKDFARAIQGLEKINGY